MNDSLGDRMKEQYEDRTRYMLPRRTWTVIRCDGKAFHMFTRGCEKPYDSHFANAMREATKRLAEEAQGAKLGYVQSDEISIALSDFDRIETQAWFDGNLQKIASVAASIVTGAFMSSYHRDKIPAFDARVFTIPDPVELANYFTWRQKDAVRNSIQGMAQCHFSAKQLHGKKQADMLAMLEEIGKPWGDSPLVVQRGTVIGRVGDEWSFLVPPIFTEDTTFLSDRLRPRTD